MTLQGLVEVRVLRPYLNVLPYLNALPYVNALKVLTVAAGLIGGLNSAPVSAQEGPSGSINPGRDCQTIRTCNFSRGGSFRGCISSYSCRTCELVPQRCSIGAVSRNCRQMRCTWGA